MKNLLSGVLSATLNGRLGFICFGLLFIHFTLIAEDRDRIIQVQEQITDVETLLAQSESDREKSSLQKRLDRLRLELELQEQRVVLEKREAELAQSMMSRPENALLEVIRSIDRSVEHLEGQRESLNTELAELQSKRDTAILQRMQIKGTDDDSLELASELDEQIFAVREGISALNMEDEAISHELRISTEIARIREAMRADQERTRVRFQVILEKKEAIAHTDEQITICEAIIRNVNDSLEVTIAKLELGRQKLGQIDDEISLLRTQTGIFNSNPEIKRQLNIARGQQKFLGEELVYLERQIAALERSRLAITRLDDLMHKEKAYLSDTLELAEKRYYRMWLLPIALIAFFVIGYIVFSHIILPKLKDREDLMVVRRFARYIATIASIVVVVAVLFEDMQGFFTIFGIVSAGLVIALQDVCASIAGWFAIIGGKISVGDRIEVDGSVGDVIDIDLLRTTFIEINSDLDVEHPTGRVIVMPNSFALRNKVANASHGHPYMWTREVITFTYESDLNSCKVLIDRVIEEETKQNFEDARRGSGKLQKQYGITDASYEPKILVKLADSGYEFSCLHVCHVKNIEDTRTRIHYRLGEELVTLPNVELAYPTSREIKG